MSTFSWIHYFIFIICGLCASVCITFITFTMISDSGVDINNNHVIKQIEVTAVNGVVVALFLTFFAHVVVDYKMTTSIWYYYMIFIIIYGLFVSACITCIAFALLITSGVNINNNHASKQLEITTVNGVFIALFLTCFAHGVVIACRGGVYSPLLYHGKSGANDPFEFEIIDSNDAKPKETNPLLGPVNPAHLIL